MDTKQSPGNLGLLFEGVNCLVVFIPYSNFSPNQVESPLTKVDMTQSCRTFVYQGTKLLRY